MIGTLAPLRISFIGGGTDIPKFYNNYGGEIVACAIDKYIWTFANKLTEKIIILKYSKSEVLKNKKKIKHRLINQILSNYSNENIDLNFIADMPSRTGLGSSSTFAVSLLTALEILSNKKINKKKIAEMACDVEIKKLKDPIGKQDQYMSSFGGLKHIKFFKNKVRIKNIYLSNKNLKKFQNSLSLIFTGKKRDASKILVNQNFTEKKNINNLKLMKSLVPKFIKNIKKGNIEDAGKILKKNWDYKKKLNKFILNKKILRIEKKLNISGIYGYKLLGAGGGGYFCTISNQSSKKKLKKKFKGNYFDVKFDFKGTRKVNLSY